jgi:hypothetical protein
VTERVHLAPRDVYIEHDRKAFKRIGHLRR